MAIIDAVSISTTGTAYTLDDGDDIVVGLGVSVVSTDFFAIRGDFSGHDATVYGSVTGYYYGIFLGDSITDADNSVFIAAGGTVAADPSIGAAVLIYGAHAFAHNDGDISGRGGIIVGGDGPGLTQIINNGTIYCSDFAIAASTTGGGSVRITNTGTIESRHAYFGEGADDTFINQGLIRGLVVLGEGDDLFDNRGGTVVGLITGHTGNDTFILAASAEQIHGGDDIDTIGFLGSVGASVTLNGAFANAGAAFGDTYAEIENIFGSTAADTFTGNWAANTLAGLGGTDILSGRGGHDRLIGGFGKDRIAGGLGNDTFVFKSPGQGGDLILDFGAAVGNNDRFEISAAGFAGGLVPGALNASEFRARADNVAQDADDRFIFRSTDKTLWFDADGNGAGGALMIADLQANAVVTAADIFMV